MRSEFLTNTSWYDVPLSLIIAHTCHLTCGSVGDGTDALYTVTIIALVEHSSTECVDRCIAHNQSIAD